MEQADVSGRVSGRVNHLKAPGDVQYLAIVEFLDLFDRGEAATWQSSEELPDPCRCVSRRHRSGSQEIGVGLVCQNAGRVRAIDDFCGPTCVVVVRVREDYSRHVARMFAYRLEAAHDSCRRPLQAAVDEGDLPVVVDEHEGVDEVAQGWYPVDTGPERYDRLRHGATVGRIGLLRALCGLGNRSDR